MKERLFDEICPYIREAGLQHRDSWKNIFRRIYDHQFLYCFTGVANVTIGETYYHVKRGTLLVIPPNCPHRFWVEEDAAGELYWFHCDFFFYEDREWLYEFYNNMEEYITLFGSQLPHPEHLREDPVFEGGYRLPECLVMENADAIEYLFRTIYKAYSRQDRFWQLAAKSAFFEILESIFRQTVSETRDASNHSYQVSRMKQFITRNYYRVLTVNEICADTRLNTEYASKLFKKETGVKLVEYLNRFRVSKAKQLLLESDLSVADIADMVGFNSENYFCSVIKKYEGKTPERLRSSLLELLDETL